MLNLFVILLLAAAASANERIINGNNAPSATFAPWQVSLQRYGSHFCGGSLISKYYVMSACHCLQKNNVYVIMGTTDYRYPYQSVYADNFFCHSSYNSNTMDYDYSMLHLSQQAATGSTNKISTIYVADREYPSGTQALITGWGLTVGGGNNLPTQLQYGYTNLMSAASCRSSWGVTTITDRMQCAGGSNAVDACQGDSGGPLAVYDGSYWVLVGNTSWGSPNCDTGVPSMWSKNYAVRDWIYYYSGV